MLHTHHAPHAARHHVSLILSLLVLMGAAILVSGPTAFTASDSAPVNLGTAINSAASDQQPAISPDGLSLYFASNRLTGSLGGFDMYVAQRARVVDPWGAAVNVGPLNTTFDEGNPAFSRDGRLLFFQSRRTTGSFGGIDIWVAQRNNPRDDFGWQPAVNVGPAVNSAADDTGPGYFEDIARGARQLYFGSARPGLGGTDIYLSEQMADGSFSPAIMVTELSSLLNETRPSIRHDGLEIFFQSNRTGSSGTGDVWVATRGSTLDAWSTPVNPGDTTNTVSVEQNPYLSSDGTALFLSSDRPGGSGGLDLYMRARTLPTPSWSITGNLNTDRVGHTATLLPNGKVLVAGGSDFIFNREPRNSAELYDPATGTWSRTGNLNLARTNHTATLLPNGKVLVAGGSGDCVINVGCSFHHSAELYDPTTGTWSITGNLNAARSFHTATLLPTGRVLVVAGGKDNCSPFCSILNSAELYDPTTGTWSITGSLNLQRSGHTATLLPNGKVLVASGFDDNTAELYDPVTGTWSRTGNLNKGRLAHSATLLSNGHVLVAGGIGDCDTIDCYPLNSAELYDPATGIWSSTGILNAANGPATILTNGKVLVVGGDELYGYGGNSTELYDPATGTWGRTANLNTDRIGHTATLLHNGKVLVAGGYAAELYDAGTSPISIDDAQSFVRQHYRDFLNREPDAGGLAFWTGEIAGCGTDLACVEVKRINVSAAFFLSIEFQETGYLVERIYKASYGDAICASTFGGPHQLSVPIIRLSEFLPDTQQIGSGVVVNQSGWDTVLENNKQAFTTQFVQRSRFTTAYPTTITAAQFVDTLNANAGSPLSQPERNQLVSDLSSGVKTRAQVLRAVAEDQDLNKAEFNRAFVLMQYFGYLRRNPNDPQDTDHSGYDFWLNKLNQFNGNFINAEMVKAFINSAEYRQRFGQP